MFKDTGEIKIRECNNMNIPVCCMMIAPSEDNTNWEWMAHNYCPRKDAIIQGMYKIEASSKEDILKLIRRYVLPLYKNAVKKLDKTGELYYWD